MTTGTTAEAVAAWVDYEPPFQLTDLNPTRVIVAMRHAFYSGYAANAARIAELEEALREIVAGETQVWDEDLGSDVIVAMDIEEAQVIARSLIQGGSRG